MAKSIKILTSLDEVRAYRNKRIKKGQKIGLVPTMGALHDGHLSLVKLARAHADKVAATIFVNPTQFAEGEDLSTYPRSEKEDVRKLQSAGCDMVYIPQDGSMYDDHHATHVTVGGAALGLETDYRPHFFGGVALVVSKLLNRVQPDVAVFGEKDYQQLLTIKRMVIDLDIPTKIIGAPIIREDDGLAMSSRNRYFDKEGRALAGQLNVVMRYCADAIARGGDIAKETNDAIDALLKLGYDRVDYVSVADSESLKLLSGRADGRNARLLLAATCRGVRLIDNCQIQQLKN